jgi:uncharacterized cupredoxin-like copper-binding protein
MTKKAIGATAALMLALGALVMAGCGGGSDSSSSSAATTSTEQAGGGSGGGGSGGGSSQSVNVSLTDFKLNPDNPTVKAGSVTFKATNDGQTTHSLEVEGPGDEQQLPNELAPGDSGELTVDLSKPGTYEWYCPIGNHRQLGMEGEITVK